MKVELNTGLLKELLGKSVKAASNNKLIPISSLICIEVKKGVLTLTTTDTANTLKVSTKEVVGTDFYAVVGVDILNKLVQKTTADKVTLELTDKGLIVKGNGTYTIDLPLDEDGKPIVFPEIKFNQKAKKHGFNLSAIRPLLAANKSSLSQTLEKPILTGYFFGNSIVTSDTFKICSCGVKVFPENVVLSSEMVNLLLLTKEDNINIQFEPEHVLFTAPDFLLYGEKLGQAEEFPSTLIEKLLNESKFESSCRLPKQAILNVLDRLTLFVDTFDKNSVTLTFTKDGLLLSSRKSNAIELINYQGSENFKDYTCSVNVEFLKALINSQYEEVITVSYGSTYFIRLDAGKITQILSLITHEKE